MVRYTRCRRSYSLVSPGGSVLSLSVSARKALITGFVEFFMATKRKKTIGQAIQEVRELDERASVLRVIAGYLRTKYLPRDAISAQGKIACNGSPVSEAMIEEVAVEFEDEAKELEKTVKAYESQEIE